MKVGDLLTIIDGKKVRITSIKDIQENVSVYNLEDDVFHNYVASSDGSLGVVVHNSLNPGEVVIPGRGVYNKNKIEIFSLSDDITPNQIYAELDTTSTKPNSFWSRLMKLLSTRRQLEPEDFYEYNINRFKFDPYDPAVKDTACISLTNPLVEGYTKDLIAIVKKVSAEPLPYIRGTKSIDGKLIEPIAGPSSLGFRVPIKNTGYLDYLRSKYGGIVDDWVKLGTPKDLKKPFYMDTSQELHWFLNIKTGTIAELKIKVGSSP